MDPSGGKRRGSSEGPSKRALLSKLKHKASASAAPAPEVAVALPSYILTVSSPSADEIDVAVLRVQNQKLAVRHQQYIEKLALAAKRADRAEQRVNIVTSLSLIFVRYLQQMENALKERLDSFTSYAAGSFQQCFDKALTANDEQVSPKTLKDRCNHTMSMLISLLQSNLDDASTLALKQHMDATLDEAEWQEKVANAEAKYAQVQTEQRETNLQLETMQNEVFRLRDQLAAVASELQAKELKLKQVEAEASVHAQTSSEAPGVNSQVAEEMSASLDARADEISTLREQCAKQQQALNAAELALQNPSVIEGSAMYQDLKAQLAGWQARYVQLQEETQTNLTDAANMRRELAEASARFATAEAAVQAKVDAALKQFEEQIVAMRQAYQTQQAESSSTSQPASNAVAEMQKLLDKQCLITSFYKRASNLGKEGSAPDAAEVADTRQQELTVATERIATLERLLAAYRQQTPEPQRQAVEAQGELASLKAQLEQATQKAEHLERDLNNAREALKTTAGESMASLQEKIQEMKATEEALFEDIDASAQAFEETRQQNSELLEKLQFQESTSSRYLAQRKEAEREKKDLQQRIHAVEERFKVSVTDKLQAELAKAKAEVHRLQVEGALAAKRLQAQIQQNAESAASSATNDARIAEMSAKCAQFSEALETAKKHETLLRSQLTSEQAARADKAEEVVRLSSRLQRVTEAGDAGGLQDLYQSQIDELKGRLTCPACNIRPKDTVMTKCFHVFCGQCVQARVDTRQRKCMLCSRAFGQHDFHKIFFD
eukprot:m.168438 g.168438  ORF g.168438 m.168438 type:complete len:781 (+) comp14477_c0_seq1:185-2527(+)